jgi:hypothetical protein
MVAHADRLRRARQHDRILAGLALGLLALIAELAGRSLTHRIDVGRHVGRVSYAHDEYYPFLLAAVKVGVALMLARLTWRFVNARRVAAAFGVSPRVRLELSPRLWLVSFVVTSGIFLVQTDAERIAGGRWPLLAPWLHTSALPVFAVLSVLVALLFRAVERWLHDYEQFAAHAVAFVRRLFVLRRALAHPHEVEAPRRIFGLVFESRPPPLPT